MTNGSVNNSRLIINSTTATPTSLLHRSTSNEGMHNGINSHLNSTVSLGRASNISNVLSNNMDEENDRAGKTPGSARSSTIERLPPINSNNNSNQPTPVRTSFINHSEGPALSDAAMNGYSSRPASGTSRPTSGKSRPASGKPNRPSSGKSRPNSASSRPTSGKSERPQSGKSHLNVKDSNTAPKNAISTLSLPVQGTDQENKNIQEPRAISAPQGRPPSGQSMNHINGENDQLNTERSIGKILFFRYFLDIFQNLKKDK